ncbi:hypothetical protein G5V59_14335 [Nocardioides sp. W3-2-3]|nr:hypothetical protein [Nocardioides convexus]
MSSRSTAVRFAAVGICNTAIDAVVFVLLHDHLGIALANLVSTTAGMIFRLRRQRALHLPRRQG